MNLLIYSSLQVYKKFVTGDNFYVYEEIVNV